MTASRAERCQSASVSTGHGDVHPPVPRHRGGGRALVTDAAEETAALDGDQGAGRVIQVGHPGRRDIFPVGEGRCCNVIVLNGPSS